MQSLKDLIRVHYGASHWLMFLTVALALGLLALTFMGDRRKMTPKGFLTRLILSGLAVVFSVYICGAGGSQVPTTWFNVPRVSASNKAEILTAYQALSEDGQRETQTYMAYIWRTHPKDRPIDNQLLLDAFDYNNGDYAKWTERFKEAQQRVRDYMDLKSQGGN